MIRKLFLNRNTPKLESIIEKKPERIWIVPAKKGLGAIVVMSPDLVDEIRNNANASEFLQAIPRKITSNQMIPRKLNQSKEPILERVRIVPAIKGPGAIVILSPALQEVIRNNAHASEFLL